MTKPLSAETERCICGGPEGDCGCALGYANAIAERRAKTVVIDTATHVAVPKMSEAEAHEAFDVWINQNARDLGLQSFCYDEMQREKTLRVWLAAYRSLRAIK